jgi:hypothetical protein
MSYSYDRAKTAAGKVPIDKLKKLTEQNDHDAAYILGAKSLGLTHLAKKFELIKSLADLEGHLPHGLSEYRYGVYKEMMKAAEQHLPADEYQAFYHSF